MNSIKHIIFKLPEYYFILLVLLVGFTPPFSFNPISIAVSILLVLQIVFKYKLSGLILSILLVVVNAFMLVAVISEFKEFASFTDDAYKLLFVGSSLWCLNMLFAGVMIYKYSFLNQPINLSNASHLESQTGV